MADRIHNTSVRLSHLFRDPVLRAAFARAEREDGAAFPVPVDPPKPIRPAGAARAIREAAHV